jgi:hypothetical protein
MSGSSKADLAAAAASTVLTADQLMRAIEASHEGKEEYVNITNVNSRKQH